MVGKAEFRSKSSGNFMVEAVVTDVETFHWLHHAIQKENRKRKIEGDSTISYSIKMSDGCRTTIGPRN